MCRTPEEAAWTVIAATAESQDLKTAVKAIEAFGKQYCIVDVLPDAGRKFRRIKASIFFSVSNELWDEFKKEVANEPTLVD